MNKPWLTGILIACCLGGTSAWSAIDKPDIVTINERFLLNPTLSYLEKEYSIDTFDGPGFMLLERLYKGYPELAQKLAVAKEKGRAIGLYAGLAAGLAGIDLALMMSGAPTDMSFLIIGAGMKLTEPIFYPVSHMSIIRESVTSYNIVVTEQFNKNAGISTVFGMDTDLNDELKTVTVNPVAAISTANITTKNIESVLPQPQ